MIEKDALLSVKLNQIVQSILEKKGEKIISLNFKSLNSSICDYFVIAEANNSRQVLSIAEEIEDRLRENLKIKPSHVEGRENAQWVLMDYFDIIVHIFQSESREFYGIERLWADAEKVTY